MPSRAERGECSALHDGGPGRERSGGGYLLQKSYHLPLFEGTPPNLGGESKELDNSYIISYFIQFCRQSLPPLPRHRAYRHPPIGSQPMPPHNVYAGSASFANRSL